MIRGASTLRWFELPGVVAAYQPVVAPDPTGARQNVGAGLLGKYTATPGVAPTWTARDGWGFLAASTQWLETNIFISRDENSILVRFSGVPATGVVFTQIGAYGAPGHCSIVSIEPNSNRTQCFNGNTSPGRTTPKMSIGVLGYANKTMYRNGIADGTIVAAADNTVGYSLNFGRYNFSTPGGYFTGNIQSAIICNRILSATEVFTASRQMAYCDTVPEFNAWARQRFYMYAPTTAGFLPAWAGRTNHLIGGGVNN